MNNYLIILVLCVIITLNIVISFKNINCKVNINNNNKQYSRNIINIYKINDINIYDKQTTKSQYNTINNFIKVLKINWNNSLIELKSNPLNYLTIPLSAAFVGYITNYIGVKMLFYPIKWLGIPIIRWENQPLGLIGWQGIVPAKRTMMATRMVDVTISKLIKIVEVFNLLNPSIISQLVLSSVKRSITISSMIPSFLIPNQLIKPIVTSISKEMIKQIEQLVDIKSLVITELTKDPNTLGLFFQFVAKKELNFLINSGFGFGLLLGVFQMLLWMLYPKNWTLPVFGGIIGYITNWIALKWIFEPLKPFVLGPFIIHGMFLRRQLEVSEDFCNYISAKVLTSYNVWNLLLNDSNSYNKLVDIISKFIPYLPVKFYDNIIKTLQFDISILSHPIHKYTDDTLNLSKLLYNRMKNLTPIEFEQVLHPIFQEDEMTLIIAGGVLGVLTGFIQWWINIIIEKRKIKEKSISLV